MKQSHFFDWFYENITCPILKNIRQQHNPMSTPLGEDEEVPVDQRFTLWGDSDIPYLQQMTSPERIDRSMERVLYFAKIGAKITETSQALDVGTGFKVMKLSSRTMPSVGSEKPLTTLVDMLFKYLKKDKILILSHLKECSLKDLIVTSPDIITASFSQSSLVKSFVDCGMLDVKCKRCADVFGLIDSFKISWPKVPGGKRWFMEQLPAVFSEMFAHGEVCEQFYDEEFFSFGL